jgi:hypothetical protein
MLRQSNAKNKHYKKRECRWAFSFFMIIIVGGVFELSTRHLPLFFIFTGVFVIGGNF